MLIKFFRATTVRASQRRSDASPLPSIPRRGLSSWSVQAPPSAISRRPRESDCSWTRLITSGFDAPWRTSSREQPLHRRLDPRPENGEEERAGLELGGGLRRRFARGTALRAPGEAGLEILREFGGQARGEVVHDARAAELGEGTGEGEADGHVDARGGAAVRLAQRIGDLAARLAGAARIAPGAAHAAAIGGIVPDEIGLAGEGGGDGAEPDADLARDVIAGLRGKRRPRQAGGEEGGVLEALPHRVTRMGDGEGLANLLIGLRGGGAGDWHGFPHLTPALSARARERALFCMMQRGGLAPAGGGEGWGEVGVGNYARRSHEPDIAGAAAEIAAELGADALLVGVGEADDDIPRCRQHARGAIAALQRVLAGEGGAELRRDGVVVEPLDRRHLGALAGDGIGDAGARRGAVDEEGAGAAHAVLAAEMGPGVEELVAQEIGEAGARLDGGGDALAVDGEGDCPAHGQAPLARAAARFKAAMRIWRSMGSVMPFSSSRRAAMAGSTSPTGRPLPFPKSGRASSSTMGRASIAPTTARQRSRAGSAKTTPMAWANSPGLRQSLI